ncbi:uncharacterized protein [Panulirus ornatus]|uniref:uncharacterized protein isoform X3 n=1 Tax=Panulirus ornatus TaxID=150431 RepID=UPI003A85E171
MPPRNSLALWHPQSGIKVNGHSLDSITREFLLDGVDQNVQESWRANYMEVDVFTTRGSPIAGTISGVLSSEDLYVPVIDGVNMDTIMLVDEAGHVGGKVTFTEDLNLDGLSSDSNVLDGCNIAELQNGAIWKDKGDVTVDFDVIVDTLIIEGNVKASADITAVKAGNKVDVKHFLNSLVLKSSDQSITGNRM